MPAPLAKLFGRTAARTPDRRPALALEALDGRIVPANLNPRPPACLGQPPAVVGQLPAVVGQTPTVFWPPAPLAGGIAPPAVKVPTPPLGATVTVPGAGGTISYTYPSVFGTPGGLAPPGVWTEPVARPTGINRGW